MPDGVAAPHPGWMEDAAVVFSLTTSSDRAARAAPMLSRPCAAGFHTAAAQEPRTPGAGPQPRSGRAERATSMWLAARADARVGAHTPGVQGSSATAAQNCNPRNGGDPAQRRPGREKGGRLRMLGMLQCSGPPSVTPHPSGYAAMQWTTQFASSQALRYRGCWVCCHAVDHPHPRH